MKKSITYLPRPKQEELKNIVNYVLEELPDCEMIILYGSYARNTYVDYDQRVEYGVRTCFMSDYDILVVTHERWNNYVIERTFDKIKEKFYRSKSIALSPSIEFINENIDDLNKAIGKGRYFYTDIKKEGVMLYDSGKYKLARRKRLNYVEIKALAEEYFSEKYNNADEFLLGAHFYKEQGLYKKTAFMLHQACENFLRSVVLTSTLYSPKEHNLKNLIGTAKTHALEISVVFPRDTEEEKRLFQLLSNSYIQARYNPHFVVTQTDVDALMPKVEQLRDITRQCCETRIKEYESLIKSK